MLNYISGELTVVAYSHKKGRERFWLCQCNCGNLTKVRAGNLVKQTTKSCGCKNRERSRKNGAHFYKHGLSTHPLYNIWREMHRRCIDPDDISYKYYGARGILVCIEWNDFNCFIKDMGERPSIFHTIDRKDNNGNYCKENCCWATKKEQAANRRPYVPNKVCVHTIAASETA